MSKLTDQIDAIVADYIDNHLTLANIDVQLRLMAYKVATLAINDAKARIGANEDGSE
jgi:hypothetical protein